MDVDNETIAKRVINYINFITYAQNRLVSEGNALLKELQKLQMTRAEIKDSTQRNILDNAIAEVNKK